jgi:hypothetical protein
VKNYLKKIASFIWMFSLTLTFNPPKTIRENQIIKENNEEKPFVLNKFSIPTFVLLILMIWLMASCKSAKSCNKYQWYGSDKTEKNETIKV